MSIDTANDPEKGSYFKDVQQTVDLIRDGATVIDVRTQEEYAEGHLADAELIPHIEIESRLSQLENLKDKTIILYCRSGRRSNWSATFLQEAGFKKAYNGGKFTELESAFSA
jgi:phage shock protein E